jgi:RNA-binding protein YhbY
MRFKKIEMQLGKNGLTHEYLEDVRKRFENYTDMKITVLPSIRKSKADVEKFAEEIKKYLGEKFTYRVLGFSIFLKKWRKIRQ